MEFKDDALHRANKHLLKIYPNELEQQPEFGGFEDWARTVPLFNKEVNRKRKTLFAKSKHYCQLRIKLNVEPVESGDLEEQAHGRLSRVSVRGPEESM